EVWGLTPEQVRGLKEAYPNPDSTWLWSEQLAVLDVPGGHVVAVANGRDGFAVRDVSGSWRRIGFPTSIHDSAPVPIEDVRAVNDPSDDGPFVFAFSLSLGGLVLILVAVRRARGAGASARLYWLLAPLAAASCGAVPIGLIEANGNGAPPGLAADFAWVPLAAVAVICPFVALAVGRRPLSQGVGATLIVAGVLIVAQIVWAMFGTGHLGHLVLYLTFVAALVTPAAAKVI
ncbi:hypothetical protein, partial [Actinoplanes campanulatus]|uniref:hypothetical protein n=1 Tax=Actinoplanes campanulatus TaxID=113559 RepID=UPI001954A86A